MKGRRRKQETEVLDQHVGSRVRLARQLRGLSQDALASRIGMTFQQVQKYERGANRIGAGLLHRLSEVLDVPVGFFYEGLGNAGGNPGGNPGGVAEAVPSPSIMNRRAARLVFLWNAAPPETRESVLALLSAIAGSEDRPEPAAGGDPAVIPMPNGGGETIPLAAAAEPMAPEPGTAESAATGLPPAQPAAPQRQPAAASARISRSRRRRRYGAVWDWADVDAPASGADEHGSAG